MKKNMILIGSLGLGLALTGCTSPGKRTAIGGGAGAAIGAAVGAAVSKKDRKKGALLGAILGGATGGTVGNILDRKAKELSQIPGVEATREGDQIVANLPGSILFSTNSDRLTADARNTIQSVAGVVNDPNTPGASIEVIGHTDSTGSAGYNLGLSQKRAKSVMSQLTASGVSAGVIRSNGYGETQPVSSNNTPQGREQNRRVEMKIKYAQ
jgi:outer membrane protein OmpA-like peptidoglycan-associated protein